MFEYAFMQQALITGIAITVSAALLGVSLVLRRNSMIGDGLSHVSFGAIAVAIALNLAPLIVAIPVAILVSIIILNFNQKTHAHGDATIAMTSAGAMAIGVIAISLSGTNIDLNSYMFGSILSISTENLILSIILLLITVIFYIVFYRQIFVLTLDEKFATAIGAKTKILNLAFAILASIVIVLGMKVLGVLLISSLIVFPNISAKTVAKSFKMTTILAVIIAIAGFIIGLIASYYVDLPTGACVVLANIIILSLCKIIGWRR